MKARPVVVAIVLCNLMIMFLAAAYVAQHEVLEDTKKSLSLAQHVNVVLHEQNLEMEKQVTRGLEVQRNIKDVKVTYAGDFTISYYCLEPYKHICNDGSPGTSSGKTATPYLTCATDPKVIPTGTVLWINGSVYVAQDTGPAVNGYEIDIAVPKHQEALDLGRKPNTQVYVIVSKMEDYIP